jgi:hypothetical protein
MERDTLDPTYSSFLIKFGGKDVRVIDSIAPLRRGGKLNRAMFMEWAREHQLKDVMGVLFGLHHYKICDVVHPDSNCFSVPNPTPTPIQLSIFPPSLPPVFPPPALTWSCVCRVVCRVVSCGVGSCVWRNRSGAVSTLPGSRTRRSGGRSPCTPPCTR